MRMRMRTRMQVKCCFLLARYHLRYDFAELRVSALIKSLTRAQRFWAVRCVGGAVSRLDGVAPWVLSSRWSC